MLTEPGEPRLAGGGPERGVPSGPEPISPELVLVAPPEVARLAREGLEESPPFERERPPAVGPIRSVATPAPGRGARPRLPARRRRGLLAVAVGAALGLAALGIALGLVQGRDGDGSAAATRPENPTRTTPTIRATSTIPTATQPTRTVAPATPAKPRPSTKPKPAAKPKPPAGPAPAGFVPARSWSWPAKPGSTIYLVRFFRNGRKVFEKFTVPPRIVLPRSFRFAAGRYRWTVLPVTGRLTNPHYGKRLIDSKFVLTAAAAAQANG